MTSNSEVMFGRQRRLKAGAECWASPAMLPSMGKIRGSSRVQRHILVLLRTTEFFGKSFIFKKNVEKERLPKDNASGSGGGVSGSDILLGAE
jgi:hypothetical protein